MRLKDGRARNLRMVVEYDGSRFHGWQMQKGLRTVQGELTKAVRKVTGERVAVIGASRTDAGVHAEGQVACFRTGSPIPADKLIHALNFYLPEDVAVRELREAPAGFHAQFAATAKTYRYTIWNGWTPRPLLRDRTAHVRGPLDLAAMRAAAAPFLGKRDFRAFGSEGGRRKTTVRTLRSIRISRRGERVEIVVLGDGFLYNMVRCIAGTLIRAGQAKIDGREVERILREGDRRSAGPVAPARGLCLMKVHYGGRRGTPDAP